MRSKSLLARKRKARMKEQAPEQPQVPVNPEPQKTGWDALSQTEKIVTITVPVLVVLLAIILGVLAGLGLLTGATGKTLHPFSQVSGFD